MAGEPPDIRPDKETASLAGDAVEAVIRSQWGRILASLTKTFNDFQLAEDALQDAVESALIHWRRNGLPRTPAAWLIQTARRKAIDRLRRKTNFRSREAEITRLIELDADDNDRERLAMNESAIPDHRLEMIFTCCHPALEEKSRLALTLRTLGGLTTEEIARAFLDRREAMAARLTRARKKIALAGIPYEIPDNTQLPERLNSVLSVIYLIFNEGYLASAGDSPIRSELTDEAIRLSRLVVRLMPEETEAAGLLALLMLHNARKPARTDTDGHIVPLEEQDRQSWDQADIAEGTAILKQALARGRVGAYQLQAAISACHCEAPSWSETDWAQILALYDLLEAVMPNPVVRLNRLLALAQLRGPEEALQGMDALAGTLEAYQPFHAARADLLARTGQTDEARKAYGAAIALSTTPAERAFLETRLARLSTG